MNDTRCLHCKEYRNCKDSFASWIFFIIGLIATIAIRVVTLLMHLDPLYGKIAWYVGIIGFLAFFVYKFRVSRARANLIEREKLLEKIRQGRKLSGDDYTDLGALLCALTSNKEQINYFFIFGLSAFALAFALYMDFFR